MRESGKKTIYGRLLWLVLFLSSLLRTCTCSSSLGKPPMAFAIPTTMDDGVQRIGVGEVLIVDEFGREARSYWDSAAAEEKVEAVTVYGGMEVVSGGSTHDGDPDVVKGQPVKEEEREDSGEDESQEQETPEENSVKDAGSESTLLDCVLHGDITCIQKKAFRALQKLIQISNSGGFPGVQSTSVTDDRLSSIEREDIGGDKINKEDLQGGQAWWTVSGGVTPLPQEGVASGGAGMVGEVMNAVSANGGMSRLLEEVRDLVVDLVSNVISLQEDDEDRKRGSERKRSEGGQRRTRRSVVPKKGAGPVPAEVGFKATPGVVKAGEKQVSSEPEGASGKGAESTSVQNSMTLVRSTPSEITKSGGKKKKRNGMGSILMGIMIVKSIFSYLGMVFSHVLQLKQLGISILSFIVSIIRLILLFRQSNNEKPPHHQTDTKVVYLKPQYNHGHYPEHMQSQHYIPGDHYKRSFDASSSPELITQDSAHDLAYGGQKPTEIK